MATKKKQLQIELDMEEAYAEQLRESIADKISQLIQLSNTLDNCKKEIDHLKGLLKI